MIRNFLILLNLFLFNAAQAQEKAIVTTGEFVFEKRINKLAVLRLMAAENNFYKKAFNAVQSAEDKVIVLDYALQFDQKGTRYFPCARHGQNNAVLDLPGYASTVSVVNAFATESMHIEKAVFEEVYTFDRTKNDIIWRITEEYRDILGFSCRRANGLREDSLYVVAFFTNEIPYFAGPETFAGLPGMILGLALPHEHISWFASRFEPKPIAVPVRLNKSVKPTQLNPLVELILNRKLDQAFTNRLLLNLKL